jgi:hypothetical protein
MTCGVLKADGKKPSKNDNLAIYAMTVANASSKHLRCKDYKTFIDDSFS